MYQVKVAYERQTGEQGLARVTEQYLVDAMSFTEAEARVIDKVRPYVSIGELEVVNIKRCKYAELLLTMVLEADKYYRAKVAFVTIDEATGAEKMSSVAYLVQADCLPVALIRLTEVLEQQLGAYRIESIAETPIVDVYMSKEEGDEV